MNKNGKGNIIFIILIPVFLILTVIIVDTIIGYTQTKTYKEVTERIIKEVMNEEDINYDEYYNEIKKRYDRRGYKTDRLVVEADSFKVYVENEHVYFGLLTSFSNKGEDIEIRLLGIEYLTFKLKKNSKTVIKVEAKYNYEDELQFEYVE